MRRSPLLLALALLLPAVVLADVRLPALVSDNMVLQRNASVTLWGWADPGEKVAVKPGWSRSALSTKTAAAGRWQIRLATGKAGGPYGITIRGKNTIELKNVMVGEVWICSGQSNMEFTIGMLGGWGPPYAADSVELAGSDFAALRLFTVRRDTSPVPLDTCRGSWSEASVRTVREFSATAYFFGREIHKKLKVPVGLIATSWGGTPAEAWTPVPVMASDPYLEYFTGTPSRVRRPPSAPGCLYNAMIHPLLNYAMKGVIWYQGESNRNDWFLYRRLFSAMIGSWRDAWKVGEFPFYYVQIAPFRYAEPLSGALLREAQLKTLSVPNTGMAVTMDIGDTADIHPKNKQEVGRRLALWALAKSYGEKIGEFSGPLYRSMRQEGPALRLFFDHCEGGLVAGEGGLSGFTVAGADGRFSEAEAAIDGNTLLVKSRDVPEPRAARFAFTSTSESRLFNRAGLPASSFRTDDWPPITR